MAQSQSVSFRVPAAEVDMVIAEIRKHFAQALIGRKVLDSENVVLAVTLYAEEAERMLVQASALGTDEHAFGAYQPSTRSMSDLIAAIRQQQPKQP